MMKNLTYEQAVEGSMFLTTQQALENLFEVMFPKFRVEDLLSGRYRFIEQIIEHDEELKNSLIAKSQWQIEHQWYKNISQCKDPRVIQGLAVLYHEQVTRDISENTPDEQLFQLNVSLWCYLLSTDEFWDYFSPSRFSDRTVEDRIPLTIDQQNSLCWHGLDELLSLHSSSGRGSFASGQLPLARLHMQCLDIARKDEQGIKEILKTNRHPDAWVIKSRYLQNANRLSEQYLDDWAASVVRVAENLVNDDEKIKNLPKGIRKNYQEGISSLENFISCDVPVLRVLRSCLNWYNEWCFDLYQREEMDEMKRANSGAEGIAQRMIPLCTKGRGHTLENQAISQYYLVKGFTEPNHDTATEYYQEAIAWNPGNKNAEDLLGGVIQKVLQDQLHQAMECMQQNRFEEAYDIFDSIEPRMKNPGDVKVARAICYFVHARALADDMHLTQAIEKAGRALEIIKTLPPMEGFTPELIQKFIKDNEKLAPEEENLRMFVAAKEYFERDNYSMAIAEAGRIPESSKECYKLVKPLLAAAYFHEGIAAANKNNFSRAIEHLEHALDLIDTKENKKIIKEQLALMLNAYAISITNDAQKTIQKFDQALTDIIHLGNDQNNIQTILSMNSRYNFNLGGSGSCPVCGSAADKISFLPTLISHRTELLTMKTSYGFWKNQREICSSCRRKLKEVDEKIEKAVSLLERAKSLDKANDTIQKNLDTIRSIAK